MFDKSKAVCTCICHEEGDPSHCTWCGGARPYEWDGMMQPSSSSEEEKKKKKKKTKKEKREKKDSKR